MSSFKNKYSLEVRKQEANRILSKYPDKVPIICETNFKCKDIPEITRNKFLAPKDFTVGQFMYMIRKRINLTPDKALFMFIQTKSGSILPPTSSTMEYIYREYKDMEDLFVYFIISEENTFGH